MEYLFRSRGRRCGVKVVYEYEYSRTNLLGYSKVYTLKTDLERRGKRKKRMGSHVFKAIMTDSFEGEVGRCKQWIPSYTGATCQGKIRPVKRTEVALLEC